MIAFQDVPQKFKGDKMPYWALMDNSIGAGTIASNLSEKNMTKSWKKLEAILALLKTGAFILKTSDDVENMGAGFAYGIYSEGAKDQQERHARQMEESTANGIEQFLYYQSLGYDQYLEIRQPKSVKILKLEDIHHFDIDKEKSEVTIKGSGINQRCKLTDVDVVSVGHIMEHLQTEAPEPAGINN